MTGLFTSYLIGQNKQHLSHQLVGVKGERLFPLSRKAHCAVNKHDEDKLRRGYHTGIDAILSTFHVFLVLPWVLNQNWQQNYSPAQQKMTLVNEGCVCGLCETRGQDVQHTPDTFPRILQALDLNKLPPSLTESELGERVGLCNKCERQIKLLEEAASIRENLKESLVSNLKHLSGINSAIHLNDKTTPVCLNYGQAFQQCNEITPDLHSMKRKLSNWTLDSQASRRKQLKTHITHTLPISPNSLITEHINYSDEENSKVANNNPISPLSPHSSHGSYTPPLSSSKHSIDGQVLSEMTCRNRRKQARPAKAEGDVVPAVPAHIALADLRVEASSPYTTLRTSTPDASLRHSRPTTPHRSATPQRSPTPQRLKTPSSQAQPQRSREPSPRLPTSASLHSPVLLPASNQQYVPTPVPAHSQLPHPVPPAAPALQPSPAHTSLPTKLPTNDQPPRQLSPRPPKSLTPSSTPGTANHQKMSYDQSKNGNSVSPFPGLPFSTSFYQNNLFNSALQSTNSTASAMLLAQSIYNAAAATKSSMLGLNNPLLFGHGMASLPGMKGMSSNSIAGSGSTLPYNNKANNLPSMAYNQLNSLNKKASLPGVNYSQMSGMKKPKKPSNNLLLHAKGEPAVPSFSYAPTKTSMDPAGNCGLPALKKSGMTVTPVGLGKTLQADAHTLVKTDKRRYCKVCAASCRKANNGRPPQSRFLCLACNMPMCRSCIEEHRYRIMMKVEDVPAKSASAKLLKAVKMKQDSKTPGSLVSAPYSKPPALSKPSSISSSTPPSHSSLIFGSASVTPDSDTITSSLPAMPSLTGQPSPKPLNPLDMRIPGYKNIAPAPPKLTNMSPKLGTSPVKSEPHIPSDVEVSVGVLEKDEEEGVLVISEQDDVEGDNPDGEISAEVASKTAAMLASIDDGDDDDSDVSLELTESDKELELNDQPSRPTSSAANSDVLPFHTPMLPTTLSVCASPEVTSKPTEEIAVLAESIQAKALQTGSPSNGSSSVLPSIKAPEKECIPITDSTPGIPIQKTALAV